MILGGKVPPKQTVNSNSTSKNDKEKNYSQTNIIKLGY